MSPDAVAGSLPAMAFVAFQACFAIIAVALVSGAIADRASFGGWTLFTVLWGILVYFPVAGWVFSFDGFTGEHGGWIANWLGALDFAGGTAIHINAGISGLALALVLGPRIGFGTKPMRPHNMTLVMLGAGLLWFGWFGFNAGSALSAGTTASVAWVNTLVATAAAMLAWLLVERFRDGHPTSLGAASGVVAGLVAITPAAGSVSPVGAIFVGGIASAACAYAVGLKYKFGYDDSLDVVGVHFVGGLFGTVLIGLFADPNSPAGVAGLFYGGGVDQLWRQAVGAIAVTVYAFVVSYLIAMLIKRTILWRITTADELSGIDLVELPNADQCCGFGGTFAMRYPDISEAIVNDKVAAIRDTGAERVVSADCGCLLNITGRAARQDELAGVTAPTLQGEHLASFLYRRTTAQSNTGEVA